MYSSNDYSQKEKSTGGTKRFLELLLGLLERGNTIHLFIPDSANIDQFPNLIRHNINVSSSRYLKFIPSGLFLFFRNYKSIKITISNINYDAIFAWDVPIAIQFVLMQIPKIVLMVRQDFIGCRLMYLKSNLSILRKIYLKIYLIAEHQSIIGSSKIILQSKQDLDTLVHRHPNLKSELNKKASIVPNNVNPSWIKKIEIESGHSFVNKSNLNNSLMLCFVGNINKLKGLEILLCAVKKLIDLNYNIKLNVIGDGDELPRLQSIYGQSPNIVFLGHLNTPLDILKSSDLLVVPSLFDSFPNTIMEALFYDVPVIGSKRGGIPEMLNYEELLFEPTAESIFEKIKTIIDKNSISHCEFLCKRRKEYFKFDWIKEIEKATIEKEYSFLR